MNGNDNYWNSSYNNGDLDIFLYDSRKIIHIATAGMELINSLSDLQPATLQENFRLALSFRRIYKYKVSDDIQRDNLNTLEEYTAFFELMAKRGFYSYDRINIDNKEDYTFQLIANPIYDKTILIRNGERLGDLGSQKISEYKIDALQAIKDFPEDNTPFDIRPFI